MWQWLFLVNLKPVSAAKAFFLHYCYAQLLLISLLFCCSSMYKESYNDVYPITSGPGSSNKCIIREQCHEVVYGLRVELSRKQVAWSLCSVPQARVLCNHFLQSNEKTFKHTCEFYPSLWRNRGRREVPGYH